MLNWMAKQVHKKKGFTLIELIVVIAILAILAVIIIPRFAGTLNRAKAGADAASAKSIESAVRIYEAENGALASGITNQTTFEAAYKSYLSEGVVAKPSQKDFEFYYETAGGKVVCALTTPTAATGETWVAISASGT